MLVEEIILSPNSKIYAVNIEEIDVAFKDYIDKKLISICKGNREIKIQTVKKQFITYLERKNESNLLTGAVSEFFIHLILAHKNYKQEFLYFNLEENSIKKGFDGYYSKDGVDWILESKSTKNNNLTHKPQVSLAYRGIKNKIEGIDNKNNPWENAYNHASHADVQTKDTLKKKITKLSELYTEEEYGLVKDFKLLVSSTIFLEEKWCNIDKEKLKFEINGYLDGKNYDSIIVICLNKKSISHLMNYLKL